MQDRKLSIVHIRTSIIFRKDGKYSGWSGRKRQGHNELNVLQTRAIKTTQEQQYSPCHIAYTIYIWSNINPWPFLYAGNFQAKVWNNFEHTCYQKTYDVIWSIVDRPFNFASHETITSFFRKWITMTTRGCSCKHQNANVLPAWWHSSTFRSSIKQNFEEIVQSDWLKSIIGQWECTNTTY